MSEIDETLGKRSPVYGPYGTQVMVRRDIVTTMLAAYKEQHSGELMPPKYQEYLWDIANKLSRIATSPNHVDSWHDIQGYAKLIEQDLLKTGEGI